MTDKKVIQNLNNAEFGKFSYDKNYIVKIEAGRQQGKSFRAGMEFSNKIWKDKIKAKIEELEKEITEDKKKNDDFWSDYSIYLDAQREGFQSLLEKE